MWATVVKKPWFSSFSRINDTLDSAFSDEVGVFRWGCLVYLMLTRVQVS